MNAAKTTRERVAAVRQRRKDAGLVSLQLWVHPDDVQPIRAYAARLQRKRAKEGKPPA